MKNSILLRALRGGATIIFLTNFILLSQFNLLSQQAKISKNKEAIPKVKEDSIPQAILGGGFVGTFDNSTFIVSINLLGSPVAFRGAGVIIDEFTILTAAHVADNFGLSVWDDLEIRAGSVDKQFCSQCRSVSSIIFHPNWGFIQDDLNPEPYDIAILKLSSPLVFNNLVQPIEFVRRGNVSDADYAIGKSAEILGWGSSSLDYISPNVLKKAAQMFYNLESSSFWTSEPFYSAHYDASTMTCIYDALSQAYSGDSGGPAIINKAGKPYLAGIISWGRDPNLSSNSNLRYPSLITDVNKVEDFVISNLSCFQSIPNVINDVFLTCGPNSNLNDNLAQTNLIVKWSQDYYPLDGITTFVNPQNPPIGDYYAYFYDEVNDCYSKPSKKIKVQKPCNSLGILEVNGNQTISSNRAYEKIIVNSGTLTINSSATINVIDNIDIKYGAKLILDNAILSKCELCPSWGGIKVSPDYGYVWGFNSQPTTHVTLRNGAIIEYAQAAIDAIGQITFFTTSNLGGAKIDISTNSSIRNCDYGIKLGPLYGVKELSTINNSFFTDNEYSIYLDGNHGLNLRGNDFNQNSKDIYAITSSLYADDNDFNGKVHFENNYPNFLGSSFINNRFYDGQLSHGIWLDAYSNATDFNIHNNQFFGTGVVALGELDFDIQGNDFHDSPEGTWINDSGLNITNDIYQNKFFDNTYGNSASGVNSVEYLKNCFENTANLSIEVNEGASIELQQGDDQDAAGNCFLASGKVGTGSTSEFFDYFVKRGELPQSCKKPGSGNFAEKPAQFDVNLSCGTQINIYGILPYIVRNCMYGNGITLQQAINLLKAEILRIQNATNINPWTKRWLIAKYKKCLDRLIKQKVKEDKDQSGRESAVQFLLSQPEFRYQSMAYGLVVESGDITRSRNMLNNLSPSDIGETEFLHSQHILLDYLSDRSGYIPSSANLATLNTAGLRKHPLAGFSRSIYHTLTGQKLPVTLTHLSGITQTRLKENASGSFLYPNPSYAGDVTIEIPDYDQTQMYSYSIQSTSGILVSKGLLSQKVNSLSLDISSGVYFVSLVKEGTPILTQKWVVIR